MFDNRHSLKWTKCLADTNFQRISSEGSLKRLKVRVSGVYGKMLSDSENRFGVLWTNFSSLCMLQKRLASTLMKIFVDRLTCMVSSAQFSQKYSLIINSLCQKLHANDMRLFDAL